MTAHFVAKLKALRLSGTMFTRFCLLSAMLLGIAFLNGCGAALSVVHGVIESKQNMEAKDQFNVPVSDAYEAALKTVTELKIVLENKSFDGKEGEVTGHIGDLGHIKIYLNQVTPDDTSIGIQARTSFMPVSPNGLNYAFARKILTTMASQKRKGEQFTVGTDTEETVRMKLKKMSINDPTDEFLLMDETPIKKILIFLDGNQTTYVAVLFVSDKERNTFIYSGDTAAISNDIYLQAKGSGTLKDFTRHYLLKNELVKKLHNFEAQGNFEMAANVIGEIQKIQNSSPVIMASAYNIVAWFYTTCKDSKYKDIKKGIDYGQKAVEYAGKTQDKNMQGEIIDTLAAAYAENGEFDKAVTYQTKAYELINDGKSKIDFMERAKAYKQGKTYSQWESETKNKK